MGSAASTPGLKATLGDLKTASLAVDDGETVHFLVTASKGTNYKKLVDEVVFADDPVATVRTYTEHTNSLYSKINLCLASDSASLSQHAAFIKQLRASVLELPLLDDCTLFRGVDLSPMEITEMEKLKRFFIPSFTSTSVDSSKAYDKSALFHIKTPYMTRYACSITPQLSDYHSTEKEVLLACYSAFHLERVERVGQKHVVTVFLDEYGSSCDKL